MLGGISRVAAAEAEEKELYRRGTPSTLHRLRSTVAPLELPGIFSRSVGRGGIVNQICKIDIMEMTS